MKLVATAPGKLVVLGEFAVLHGAPALVVAVDRRARVELEPESGALWRVDAPALGLEGVGLELREGWVVEQARAERTSASLGVVRAVLEAVAARVSSSGGALHPMHVTTDTSAFVSASGEKLGLGASAAVATALFHALFTASVASPPVAAELLGPIVAAHRAAQGGGSGIDVAASLLGGVVAYSLDRTGAPRAARARLPGAVQLAAVWSGASQSTPAILAALAAHRRRDPAAHEKAMTALATAARAGVEAAGRDDARGFLDAAAEFSEAYAGLGRVSGVELVSAAHQRLGDVVRSAGGVYKPSGAGGDLGLALSSDRDTAGRVESALKSLGVVLVPVRVAAEGVALERSE